MDEIKYMRVLDSSIQDDVCFHRKRFEEAEDISNDESRLHKFINDNFHRSCKYLQHTKSLEEAIIIDRAFSLGEEYAKELSESELTVEQKKVALYGYLNEFNVVRELKANENADNLIMLIDAINYHDFEVMNFFDERREYLDYDKIEMFLKEKRKEGD